MIYYKNKVKYLFLHNSMAECLAVNQEVAGSSPAGGALNPLTML